MIFLILAFMAVMILWVAQRGKQRIKTEYDKRDSEEGATAPTDECLCNHCDCEESEKD